MIKPHELRPMSEKEITQRIKDNLEALDKMKFQKAVGGEVKNPVQVRFLRKEIARMRSILREREIAAAKNKPAEASDKNEVA
jgi:large subunit ribosomal protein L29